ncbi:PREDICTED: transmembrane protein 127-like [Papilio xuthus]|uniref:Transmembrane protein 127-like n=1 Tax=Papilio xuthus TaxID=66420 RepID=A0AAJ6ZIZ5_PAPXU|nr:PREDICTED: transmembrane protein 127-like [Papilio xuthus]
MGCLTWIRGLKIQLPFKDKELNKIAAFFNVITFLLTCAALVQPSWFRIKGLHCTQSLSPAQFFTFDDDDDDNDQLTLHQNKEYDPINRSDFNGLPPCTTPEIITLMRVLILLCFMVLLCSCIGVLINLTSLNSKAIKILRRNAIPSIMCVFWVIAIVGVCYYTTVVLGNVNNSDPNTIQVDYEYGFYTITGAGALALLASAANLWGAPLSNDEDLQRRNLMEDWDGYEAHSVGPTPAVPTLPPYTPTADYISTLPSNFAPPVLGTQQYFPFDDLSILPPPPPYTP